MGMSTRKKTVLRGFCVIVVALLLAWWLWPKSPGQVVADAAAKREVVAREQLRLALKRVLAQAPAKADEPAPVIDKVFVEKTEVCAGEENLVTIEAHSPTGRDLK